MDQIILLEATVEDALTIHAMQNRAFQPLLEKYLDFKTSPANESLQKIVDRFSAENNTYYLIHYQSNIVGSIRIVKKGDSHYRISPMFVIPDYQGKGIAKAVMQMIEQIYEDALWWELDTVLEEQQLCHFYESLGYVKTMKTVRINSFMTIVGYEKFVV